jgi:hypothetical protein
VSDVASEYVLDTSVQDKIINVRSNFGWTITAVADGDDILQNEGALEGTTGAANTGAGNPLTITLQKEAANGSKNGKTATITFTSLIDGSMWYITITATDALYVGMFGGAVKVIGTNEWQFENKLYIQARDQSSGLTWGPTGDNTGVRDYWDGKGNTLALYQRSSTNYPAANACFTKNSGHTSITEKTDANYVWYLPAQKQLMAVWVSNNSFDAYKLSADYRSATENSTMYAWNVNFGDGATHNYNDKATPSLRVRCVREGN